MDAKEFIAILVEASGSTETLTDAERAFLLDDEHLDPALLTPEAQSAARAQILAESLRADSEAENNGYTTGEVAQMLGTQTSNVRRKRSLGELYALGAARNRESVFPRWQFRNGRAIPHLRSIIPALPADMHPLDVETVLTAPQESLDGRSVVDWLADGGALDPVLEIVEDMGRA